MARIPFIGIQPLAELNQFRATPKLPNSWPEKYAVYSAYRNLETNPPEINPPVSIRHNSWQHNQVLRFVYPQKQGSIGR
jgi:hypothetical protein